jgi:hypothetical protein
MQRAALRARQSAAYLTKHLPGDKKKMRCLDCGLYREHQRYKFRIVTWVIYPATLLLLVFIAQPLRHFWKRFDVTLSRLIGNVSLLPTAHTPGQQPLLEVSDVSWAVVIVVGLVLVSVFMKTAEYLVFKRGL